MICRFVNGPKRFEYPKVFEYDKEKVFRLKKNLKNGKFAQKLCQTNSFGYRDNEIPVEKGVNDFRIVAVGDSVTFGHGVSQDEAYPNKLEYMLNNEIPAFHFDVINTAVPGNCAFQEYYDFKRALVFKPDIVILQYDLNDVIEPYKVYRRYGAGGMDYHKVMDVPSWHHWLSEHSRLYLYLRYAYLRVKKHFVDEKNLMQKIQKYNRDINWTMVVYPPKTQKAKEAWANHMKWIEKHAALCHRDKLDCVVFVSPSERQIYADDRKYIQDVIRDFAAKNNLYYIDVLEVLKEEIRLRIAQHHGLRKDISYPEVVSQYKDEVGKIWQEYFMDIDHYTPRGHTWLAGILCDFIKNKINPSSASLAPRQIDYVWASKFFFNSII